MRLAVPRALRPFETRGYRFLALSLALSLVASGVWLVSLVWQVIALGGGPSDVSLVAAASALGLVLAVLLGGVAADRVPQRRLLIAVEIGRLIAVLTTVGLDVAGVLTLWHLVVVAFLLGVAEAFFFPAYSAILPRLLPSAQLLAANGVEGALRPVAQSAAGPAIAGAVIAVAAPSAAFVVAAVGYALALIALIAMGRVPFERAVTEEGAGPILAALRDVREGFAYMARTRWLLATLLFAIVLVFLVVGPIEVLVPFAVRDQTGTGASGYALALTAYGCGGVVGSIVVSSRPIPRRYLTTMILLWGFGALPFVLLGVVDQLWMIAAILFVDGVTGAAAQVLWGTLLQQRVPSALLGRVSSLDFFVSLALMPVSMAVAGPAGEAFGLAPTFAVVGVLAAASAVLTLLLARLGPDERAHPLRGVT
ncbi:MULTISPECIES: MFS transporter [unclassified Rathayibacter]|uniref:MFS transporter n=1 Tax=unclassified Rathayibacter TaxID=2609250 RepID=UPI00188A6FB9|nr:MULTISPECIES: MFS transporter [unclassified Rathayibacter]MBF4462734.1 MFS transporter [Rathayibacter sp. VKM Ac-2879]MBF4504148.1 MFS transporter [Rathayibacter sp. VKM Ac-2878]